MDESGPTQNRRFPRSNVLLTATLELPGASHPILLRNLCQEGAQVEGEGLPEAGTRVLLHRQGLSVPGRVVWSRGGRAGIEFDLPLYPGELLRQVPTVGRRPPPPPTQKRPGFGARPLSEAERLTIERWATEAPSALGN